jgi:hypothetical protein
LDLFNGACEKFVADLTKRILAIILEKIKMKDLTAEGSASFLILNPQENRLETLKVYEEVKNESGKSEM